MTTGEDHAVRQYIAAETYTESPGKEYEKKIFGGTHGPLIARTALLVNKDDQGGNLSTYAAECELFWQVRTTIADVNATTNFTYKQYDYSVGFDWNPTKEGGSVLVPRQCIVQGRNYTASSDEDYNNNCRFVVGRKAHLAIQRFLTSSDYGFVGRLTLLDYFKANGTKRFNRRNLFTFNINQSTNTNATASLSRIGLIWSNIAFATTAHIRSSQSLLANNTSAQLRATGTVSALVFYYKIDWWRLAGPGAVVLCCALFVLYTALLTRRQYAWRMSSLPVFFHGLEDHEKFVQDDMRDLKVMEGIAKEMRVRLTEHDDANGARFMVQN